MSGLPPDVLEMVARVSEAQASVCCECPRPSAINCPDGKHRCRDCAKRYAKNLLGRSREQNRSRDAGKKKARAKRRAKRKATKR